ncbi:unnamed protein product [Linum trigynum]|uniref:GTD-binding domain-containing protein n=1 Tax=Linum trigynum TaxID=586398 RepID=A0AAV2EAP3_9ROSI
MGNKVISKHRDIRSALASAVLEWLLISMLLVNAVFTYLISKFAQYCGLQAPCPLCSRLDHILGSSSSKKLKSYWDLVCRSHKLEVSSLVLCHAHNNLVDVHGMCETCLFSFATTNKSNAETYRLLVGKLGEEDCDFGDSSSEVDHTSKPQLNCSCCNEPWTSRATADSQLMMNSSKSIDSEAVAELGQDIPKINDQSWSASSVINDVDPLSHVEYTEVTADSDTECEARGSVHETHPLMGYGSLPASSSIYVVDPLSNVKYTEVNADSDAECEAWVPVHETQPLMRDVSVECAPMDPLISSLAGNFTSDPLAHVGYIGVKVDSDAESEGQISDEEEDNSNVSAHETQPLIGDDAALEGVAGEPSEGQVFYKEGDADASADENHLLVDDVSLESLPMEPQGVVPPEVDTLEKLMQPVSVTDESPIFESEVLFSSPATNGHDSEELKWQQAENAEPSGIPELICLDNEDPSLFIVRDNHVEKAKIEEDKFISSEDVSPHTDARETIVVETSKSSNFNSIDDMALPLDDVTENAVEQLGESKLPLDLRNERKLDEDDALSPMEEVVSPVEGLKESNGKRTEEIWQPSATDSEQVQAAATTTDMCPDSNQASSGDNTPNWHNLLDLGDAYKLAITNNGRQLSGLLAAEQWLGKDSSRLSEDLRTLASQLSSGVREQSLSPRVSMSPRVPMSPKLSLNNSEVQMLQKRMPLERNESGLSLDGTLVSEIEGESLVDRLKRQVEHDKKLLGALYKELEEERNASAVAANQAMAMITRLQEEKASLQMEAQQCLRVMEDQAEYDMDALQMMNDLLAEKERVIQDLEAELEFYRSKFPDAEEEEEDYEIIEEEEEEEQQQQQVPLTDIRVDHQQVNGFRT